MKFIVFSDLHIHRYDRYRTPDERLENCLSVIDLVFAKALEHKVDAILFSGDLFDKMAYLHSDVVDLTLARFLKYEDRCDFYCISGNHDMANKSILKEVDYIYSTTGRSSLRYLTRAVKNVKLLDMAVEVIAKDEEVISITGIPYFDYKEDFLKAHDYLMVDPDDEDITFSIVLTHQTFRDYGNEMIPYDFDYKDEEFTRKYDFVINGHIHKPFTTQGMLNCGSPQDIDISDIGQEKFIYLLDTEAGLELISTDTIFPKIVTYKGDEIPERLSNHYVELIPDFTGITVSNTEVETKFSASLDSIQLTTNYLKSIGKGDTFTIKVAIEVLSQS